MKQNAIMPAVIGFFSWIAVLSLLAGGISGFIFSGLPSWALAITTSIIVAAVSSLVIFFKFLRPFITASDQLVSHMQTSQPLEAGVVGELANHSLLEPLVVATKNCLDNFNKAAKGLVKDSDTVAIGSAEVSYFTSKLSTTLNEQVEMSTQVAVASEEISQNTVHVANNAKTAMQAASDTRSSCSSGQESIKEIVDKIHGVSEDVRESSESLGKLQNMSEEIQSITQVVDSVAEQTNLLALNAAIEAARAGDQGRGFAVVADEVRQLASKTTSATNEISSMLNEIQRETNHAVNTMSKLVTSVDTVVHTTEEVSSVFTNITDQAVEAENQLQHISTALSSHTEATGEITRFISQIKDSLENTESETKKTQEHAQYISQVSENIFDYLSEFNLDTIHDEIRVIVQEAVDGVQDMLEQGLNSGELTEQGLFHPTFTPIPNTDPTKYNTEFDAYTDKNFPTVQEAALKKHPNLVFVASITKPGYIGTHNDKYCQPITGDYDVDIVNSRTKRIFEDNCAQRNCSNTKPFLVQTYMRDTGVVMHDLSIPVYVRGKHWGAVRAGYQSSNKNQ